MLRRIVRFLGFDLVRRLGWICRKFSWIGRWVGRVAFYPAFESPECSDGKWIDWDEVSSAYSWAIVMRTFFGLFGLFLWASLALGKGHHRNLGWLAFCLFVLSPLLRYAVPVCHSAYGKMQLGLKSEKERIRREWASTTVESAPTDPANILLRPAQPNKSEDAVLLRPLNGSGS